MLAIIRLEWFWRTFTFIYTYTHTHARVLLLVCTLHSRAVVAPFLIRTIVIGLFPASACRSLTPVIICQVNLLCIGCNNRSLSSSRQQALQFLKKKKTIQNGTNELRRLKFEWRHQAGKNEHLTHVQFFRAYPVVFGELDVKLDVEISFLERIPVLRHSLALHHSNTACRTHSRKTWKWLQNGNNSM